MKIAFITYEYPPDTAFGGIATYVHQAANMLHKQGHYIEIFCGSHNRSCSENPEGFLVHRIKEQDIFNFYKPAGSIFARRHAEVQFDVLEGPEYMADAREAVRLVPDIPLAVKLHTPSKLLFRLNYPGKSKNTFTTNLRFYINSLIKGIKPYWGYDAAYLNIRNQTLRLDSIERMHALSADEIVSPSKDLGKILTDEWGLDNEVISYVPYPYQPDEKLLNIPVTMDSDTITFLGRLEVRKGVVDLAEAIPLVLQQLPKAKFRFVGPADISPDPDLNMDIFLKQKLKNYKDSVEFTGAVLPQNIPGVLCATDICVFPSLWENFPLVCLESMAAGRAIIASNNGGMKDMLDGEETGKLIPPGDPNIIANNLIRLLKDKELCKSMGREARNRLLIEYNMTKIGIQQINSYQRAIRHRRSKGIRQIANY